jgi:hypothetical protein
MTGATRAAGRVPPVRFRTPALRGPVACRQWPARQAFAPPAASPVRGRIARLHNSRPEVPRLLLSRPAPAAARAPARPPAAGFGASDRLAARARRWVVAHPHAVGSVALHALVLGVLLGLAGDDEAQRAQVAAERARAADRIAQTELRALQRRVERMEAVRRLLGADGGAVPASTASASAAPSSPAALEARARALSQAIADADLRARAATLARLTHVPLASATRTLRQEAAASRAAAPAGSRAEIVAGLEAQARRTLEARRAQVAVTRRAGAVTLPTWAEIAAANAANAAASGPPASGSTGQARAADGHLRSMLEQVASMIRLGPAQGRVGVNGARSGRSVNQEGVRGVAGGRVVDAADAGPGKLSQDLPAITARGNAIDLTHAGEGGSHDLVRYVAGSVADPRTARKAAGRSFGPGGTFARRVYLDSWYVIGPFAGRGEGALERAYPPEDEVDLDGAYPGKDGRLLTWKYASRGFYPFLPPDPAQDAVYYACTELRFDDDRDVWLAIGAANDTKLWLDGRLVWVSDSGDKPWYHPPYYLGAELTASYALVEGQRRVHLGRGRHRLLLKLVANDTHAFFSVVLAP